MGTAIQKNQLEKILRYTKWRHRIELQPGMYTMGYNTMPHDWEFNCFPQNLKGKSVLDVGANDGYFSFEAERRGASAVCAVDIYSGDGETMYEGWDSSGIALAKEYLNSAVEVHDMSVYDLHKLERKFDVVLCSDVLSWLEDIPRALKELTDACAEKLILKDEFLTAYSTEPALLYRGRKKSVTYRMNVAFVREQLDLLGFKITDVKPINSRKHIEWQVENFPGVFSNKEVAIYTIPGGDEIVEKARLEGDWLLGELEGYGFISRRGWVKLAEVQVLPRYRKNALKKIIKRALPDSIMDWYYSQNESERGVAARRIEAVRK